MHVLLVNHSPIPVFAYGGTERVIWDLAKCLVEKGHQVSFLVPKGSSCPFAQVIELDPDLTLQQQIPAMYLYLLIVDITHQYKQIKNGYCHFLYIVQQ